MRLSCLAWSKIVVTATYDRTPPRRRTPPVVQTHQVAASRIDELRRRGDARSVILILLVCALAAAIILGWQLSVVRSERDNAFTMLADAKARYDNLCQRLKDSHALRQDVMNEVLNYLEPQQDYPEDE